MKKVWYLLKKRRYEGPFHLDDLNIKAQQGLVSPDDYLIDEENFTKGQMVYKKASELLHRDCFVKVLSAPEAPLVTKTSSQTIETQAEHYESGRAQESYKSSGISGVGYQSGDSALKDWLSSLSFTNVATTCVVVLGAFWFFERNNATDAPEPADLVAESSVTQKRTVQREVVQRDYRKSPASEEEPVKRLMPTERPREIVRGEVTSPERGAPNIPRPAQPQVVRDQLKRGVGSEQERGIASDPNAADSNDNNSNEAQDSSSSSYDSQLDDNTSNIDQVDDPPPPLGNEEEPYYEDTVAEPAVISEDEFY